MKKIIYWILLITNLSFSQTNIVVEYNVKIENEDIFKNNADLRKLMNNAIQNSNSLKFILKYHDFIKDYDLFVVKFCAIFYDEFTDFSRLFSDLKFTNFEKKFFKTFRKFYQENQNIENFDNSKINELALFYPKNFLLNFFILFFAKNNHKLIENSLENIINYVINLRIPNFVIDANDLKSLNCQDNFLSFYLQELKILWAKSNFSLSKNELLNSIKIKND